MTFKHSVFSRRVPGATTLSTLYLFCEYKAKQKWVWGLVLVLGQSQGLVGAGKSPTEPSYAPSPFLFHFDTQSVNVPVGFELVILPQCPGGLGLQSRACLGPSHLAKSRSCFECSFLSDLSVGMCFSRAHSPHPLNGAS